MEPSVEQSDRSPVHHERRDANISGVLVLGLGLFLMIVVVLVAMRWVFAGFLVHAPTTIPSPSPLATERVIPPAPRLEIANGEDLKQLRQSEDAVLNSYGWVDRETGQVRIPIGQAIDVLAQKGLPTRSAEETKP